MSQSVKQPLDSRQLRAFITLARTSSVTLAAKELFLTQSAVSHSIKSLEQEIGCRLFDRSAKNVVLTQAGEQLLAHAEKILQEMSVARAALEQWSKWGAAQLRVAASAAACQHILPPVLSGFQKRFPKCRIKIELADTARAVDLTQARQVDLALALAPRDEIAVEFRPLFEDELKFVVGADHPWAKEMRAPRPDIPRQSYILPSRASDTFRLIQEYFASDGVELNMAMEVGSMESIKELVKLNVGVGLLPPWIAAAELASGALAAIPPGLRKLRRRWVVLHERNRRLNWPEESFIQFCKDVTRRFEPESERRALASTS